MEDGGIYVSLWRRPAEAGNRSVHQTFHWGLIITRHGSGRDSVCCHVTGGTTTGWSYETRDPYNAFQSLQALRFCRIGNTDNVDRVKNLLVNVPILADSQAFSCRTWAMQAVQQLHDERIVICPDVGALERELWQLGSAAILAGQQGRWTLADVRWSEACRHPPFS